MVRRDEPANPNNQPSAGRQLGAKDYELNIDTNTAAVTIPHGLQPSEWTAEQRDEYLRLYDPAAYRRKLARKLAEETERQERADREAAARARAKVRTLEVEAAHAAEAAAEAERKAAAEADRADALTNPARLAASLEAWLTNTRRRDAFNMNSATANMHLLRDELDVVERLLLIVVKNMADTAEGKQ